MPSRQMLRATRASTALPGGKLILQTVLEGKAAIIATAKLSRPPIAAVSAILAEKFPKEVQDRRIRQFIGLCVGAVLHDAGFEVAYVGVRLKNDPIFATGAVYRLLANDQGVTETEDVVERMMKALTIDEAKRAYRALRRNFPSLVEDGN